MYQTIACRLWGAQRLLPVGRRLRVSATSCRTSWRWCTPSRGSLREHICAVREPPIHRRRRPALVASAVGPRRAHALLGRLSLAASGDMPLHPGHAATLAILDETARFLEATRWCNAEDDSYYDLPGRSDRRATIYAALRAARIVHGLRFGAHGLPLIGLGRLERRDEPRRQARQRRERLAGLFLCHVLGEFAEVARLRNDPSFADRCDDGSDASCDSSIEQQRLGRRVVSPRVLRRRLAARVDHQRRMPDRFDRAELVGAFGRRRRRRARARAMNAVDARLVRRDHALIQLLDPPFDKSDLEPGYIRGYVPGVRENGGQYTHGAIWSRDGVRRRWATVRARGS